MTRPRVFVDTNVLFSAIYSGKGAPAQLLQSHLLGEITFVLSRRVVNELVRELTAKLPSAAPLLFASLIGSPPEFVADPAAAEVAAVAAQVNLGDAPIWAAVVAADVDYFVTGDRRLLRECRAAPSAIPVLTPRELVERIERQH